MTDEHCSRQLGEELNNLFSKWQENFQPLEPPPVVTTFQDFSDGIVDLASADANSTFFATQLDTCQLEDSVTENLWTPVEDREDSALRDLDGAGEGSSWLPSQDEIIFSNCTVEDSSMVTRSVPVDSEEYAAVCSTTRDDEHSSLSIDVPCNSSLSTAFGTKDEHYFALHLFLNRRKQQMVEECLDRIYSLRKQQTLQRQPSRKREMETDFSQTPHNTPLYKYANYFVQRLGFSSNNLFRGYVPFFGVEKMEKGRRQIVEPKRHSDAQRVGALKRKELCISSDKSFRPRNFQQILEKLVMRGAQEERYQDLVDQLSAGSIGHLEFRKKINEISAMTLLDASHRSVKWSREKWADLVHKNITKLSKNVQVDDVRLYWVNYGAAFYRKDAFTKEEDEAILQAVTDYGEYHWVEIAKQVNTGRSPWQYFCRYQQALRPNVLTCKWTIEEDMKLLAAIEKYGTKQWSLVSCSVPGRTRQQCLHRWRRALRPDIRHGKWTLQEDKKLQEAVEIYGEGRWSQIAQMVPGRTDLQCRERYTDILKPSLSHQPWTQEENERLLQLCQEMGTGKWSLIASLMKDRTDNQCYRQYKKLLSEPRKLRKRSTSTNHD
ncbi:hypothetical protein GAYE_SCF54G6214 [Galdieria yellowstonensis]|uniref:Uncharacterized protein n=1 Tax=Galdieria yellowstonensis TaxID=3028027 RepID=A0AAV9ILD4_9RHOD|nr:hypothetical protein GAYE_SCF54G6214 [Galdieria yellowstonensis]